MTLLADRYELGDELGAGGMAVVRSAHDHSLDRAVAVKLLRTASDPTTRQRFVDEARTAARFHHPNAVTVHDAGEHDGQPYLVMELVRGRSLADHLDAEGPLPVEDALAISVGVLDALAAAHTRGLVHRDVKPANVLLPDDGDVKLADFGIAKSLDEATTGLTATGTIIGTANYVAPELVQGARATPASDVYSAGCVVYEMLAGRPPFTGEHPVSVAYAHVRSPVPPLQDLRPDLPADLLAVVERALAKDPAQRYRDAGELRDALLDGPEVAPGPAQTVPLAAGTAVGDDETRALAGAPVAHGGGRSKLPAGLAFAAVAVAALAILALSRGWLDADPIVDEPADPAPAEEVAGDEPGDVESDEVVDEPDEAADDPDGEDAEPVSDDDPASIDALVLRLLAADEDQYGDKTEDLRDDLIDVLQERGQGKQAKEAGKLQEEVAEWVEKGELDPDIGEWAIQALEPLATQTGSG